MHQGNLVLGERSRRCEGGFCRVAGVLLGPVYPGAVAVLVQLVPRQLQISSFSIIASVGSPGGRVAPFFTGVTAQKVGPFVLHLICLGLYVIVEITWWALPKVPKKTA